MESMKQQDPTTYQVMSQGVALCARLLLVTDEIKKGLPLAAFDFFTRVRRKSMRRVGTPGYAKSIGINR
jgi:hypothetical protein